MNQNPGTTPTEEVPAIFVSAQEAARILGLNRVQTVYDLLDKQVMDSRYLGRRRMILLSSLRRYAEGLPAERAS